MKRSFFLSLCALAMAIVGRSAVRADDIHLFLEYNTISSTWELLAEVQTPGSVGSDSGANGIAGFTTGIYNIEFGTNGDAITIAPGINAILPNSGQPALDLGSGLIQLLYGQDISDAPSVVGGVGVGSPTLIASGAYSGVVPSFDPIGGSVGNFLAVAAPGTQTAALQAATAGFLVDVTPSSVLLGDMDLNGIVDALDIAPFVALLSGGGFQLEADIAPVGAPDGILDALDIAPFVIILGGGTPLSAGISAVPEPSSLALLMVAGFFGLGRGRRS